MEYDAIIVGAGFSGLHTLLKLRRAGLRVRVLDDGAGLGSTWWWNRYPGARVDSDHPFYQFMQETSCTDFPWTERFPGHEELQAYFKYADGKLNFSKDIQFNTRVASAVFNWELKKWLIKTIEGASFCAQHLILAVGFASKRYTPPFKGLETFKGQCYHSSNWPLNGLDLKGKRVGIIGTGATGVQIIQQIGPSVKHLTVYQRTPNIALAMQQARLADGDKKTWKFPKPNEIPGVYEMTRNRFAGMTFDFTLRNALDDTEEQRLALYQQLWDKGGFNFWIGTYQDVLFSQEANDTAYNFWRDKVRARVYDPVKKELLAPMKPPHAFGTKRPCLEQAYYEVYNQPNVDLINVRDSKILEITPNGVKTEKEVVIDIDVLILATGFDCLTGGLLDIELNNGRGLTLRNKWKNETCTYLGLTIADFPNMYFLYGAQAPTSFSNGPTCGGIQGDWVVQLITAMANNKKVTATPMKEAQNKWTTTIRELWANSLFPATDSWYQGANIPGKRREALNYIGGIPAYIQALEECAKNNYEGFILD